MAQQVCQAADRFTVSLRQGWLGLEWIAAQLARQVKLSDSDLPRFSKKMTNPF